MDCILKKKTLVSLLGLCLFSSTELTASQVIRVYGAERGTQMSAGSDQSARYVLNLGAFKDGSNAERYKNQMQAYTNSSISVEKSESGRVYNVFAGPFNDVGNLNQASEQILAQNTIPSKPTLASSSNTASGYLSRMSQSMKVKPPKTRYKPRYRTKPSNMKHPAMKSSDMKHAAMKHSGRVDSKMGPMMQQPPKPYLSFLGSLGYTGYDGSYGGNGQSALGRFAVGLDLYNFGSFKFVQTDTNHFSSRLGFEVGVQSGKRLPIETTQDNIDLLGGTPIWTTVQPMLDFLGTLKLTPVARPDFFGVVKGGFALRRWQMDRSTINNLYQVAGEVQAGFGFEVTPHTSLSLLYQGVYGSNPDFRVNAAEFTGKVSNIPMQNGGLLTLSAAI